MKKVILFTSLLIIFFAFSAETFAQEKEEKPETPIEVLMEQDATHNLNVAWQYFKLKKAYKAVLMRTEETMDAFPAFSKMDEVLYLSAMSSFLFVGK